MFWTSSVRSSLNMRTLSKCNHGFGEVFSYLTTIVAHNSTFATSTLLSATSKESCISKLQTQPSLRPIEVTEGFKNSAVLVPLVDLNGQAGLVFTKRSKHMRSHRGEVSFPGGKQEPTDSSLVQTACRETVEELGVDENQIRIWTPMSPYSTYDTGGHVVTPVVAFLDNFTNTKLNVSDGEVDEVFVVEVKQLCEEKMQGYTQFKERYSLPVYTGAKHRVWGLTALITFQLLRALVPRRSNRHRVVFQSKIKL